MEEVDVQDAEAGIHAGVQGAGCKASEVRTHDRGRCAGTGSGRTELRNWVKAAEQGKLNPPGGKVVTAEQMELSRLRVENARLRMECEILKKATAYFAKDAL